MSFVEISKDVVAEACDKCVEHLKNLISVEEAKDDSYRESMIQYQMTKVLFPAKTREQAIKNIRKDFNSNFSWREIECRSQVPKIESRIRSVEKIRGLAEVSSG